jgi:hypothetical protein
MLFSCEEKTKRGTQTHIGGEIVNSNNNYLTLEKDGRFIDSIQILKNGTFNYSFEDENFNSGLYTIRHSPEGQVFYIEEGDSLLLRVNTKEFDESLMYTGNKAPENNFLMEMYLLNERDNKLILSYYKISPEEFAVKTDSIKEQRKEQLLDLQAENDFSEEFITLANKTIDYEYYDLRERYAYLINVYFNEFKNKLPKGFFAYRKNIDFNDKSLQSYYTYQRFLDNYLKNKAITRCLSNSTNKNKCLNTASVENLKYRLIIADSLFTIDNLRDRYIGRFARKQINSAKNEAQIDSTLKLLKTFGYPEAKYDELKALGRLQKNYFEGKYVGDAKLISPNGENVILKNLLSKPTITFTWSVYVSIHKEQHDKINELRNKYPEIQFLGVNIDEEDSYELWVRALNNFDYEKDFELKIRERGDDFYLYKNFLNKVMLINKKAVIINPDLDIFSPNFELQLLEFLNQQ